MPARKPNVVLIYADDLGQGMLSCYGQTHYATPNIDAIAQAGMQFTRAYGTSFCAPARASLLCGVHDAHAGGWTMNNAGIYKSISTGERTLEEVYEIIHNTGIEARARDMFLPMVFKKAGYVTGQIGKLEWGFSTTGPELDAHGWDYHYGYYDHERCHGYYPPFLFENGRMFSIPGNTDVHCGRAAYAEEEDAQSMARRYDMTGRAVYSQDLFDEKIEAFLTAHREEPFFLYHPTQLPHGPFFMPEPHPQVAEDPGLTRLEKDYASMVLRLDETVGKILDTLRRLGLYENTIVIFSADNGSVIAEQPGRTSERRLLDGTPIDNRRIRFTSEAGGDVFNGNNGMSGLKGTNWEGGGRLPWLIQWPGRIAAGQYCHRLTANYDLMATFAQLLEVPLPGDKDGRSLLPCLLETGQCQPIDPQAPYPGPAWDLASPEEKRDVIFASQYGPVLIAEDGWKLRTFLDRGGYTGYSQFGDHDGTIHRTLELQLYYLPDDPREERDLAGQRPDKLRELAARLLKACDGNFLNGTPQMHFAAFLPTVLTGSAY